MKPVAQRKETQLDKIRSFLMGKRKSLSRRDKEKCMRLQDTNAKLCIGYSREQCCLFLMNTYEIGRSEGYRIVRETLQVFGDVDSSTKKGMRKVMYENFMLVANLARQKGDLKNWNRALENASRINGLFDHENLFDPRSIALPEVIIFTSDPEVLKKQPEDIPHVEIPAA